jgi:hypothetical protein
MQSKLDTTEVQTRDIKVGQIVGPFPYLKVVPRGFETRKREVDHGESPLMQSDDVTQPYYTLSSSSLEVVDAVEIGYTTSKDELESV